MSMNRRHFMSHLAASAALTAPVAASFTSALAANTKEMKKGQKACIMLFMNAGPPTIDIWDLKPGAATGGPFKEIETSAPGVKISEHMPMMANALDKATLIRSMSYTPNGLFNHTAAIYQMLTGYPPDKVSQSGQLEPPNAADFPTAGSHISKMIKMQEPVLPFVELPRRPCR